MRCSNCGADNPVGKKFCGDCGTPVGHHCPQCGADNPADKRFCGDCGAALSLGRATTTSSTPGRSAADIADVRDGSGDGLRTPSPSQSSPTAAAAQPKTFSTQESKAAEGERRHLTVLFCELANSTEIAARLDPEEWREVAAEYHRTAAAAITRFGGESVKYLGASLVGYFGYPAAHEDDAERAVRAGSAIIEGVAGLNHRLAAEHDAKLSVRVGIHSGSVVVGRREGKDTDIFGDTPNIATQIQAAAALDTVLISAAVQQLVAGLFVLEDRGAQVLRGIEQPMQLYRVIGPNMARRRTRGANSRGLTTFVGRQDEIGLALSRWERAREGEGQLVLVVGEPGIGKSRLIEEFHGRIKQDRHLWIECAAEQYFESTPFHAVTQILDQSLGLRGDESNEERLRRLEFALESAEMKLLEVLPLIAEMLNLPLPEKYPPLMLTADQRRKRLLAGLVSWVLSHAQRQPVVIAVEDLHWVDPSSLELTQMLVEQGATAPLMLLYTARPEFRSPWPMRAHHLQITLSRLNDRETREMVAGVAARNALAKDVVDAVIKRTDGVPLFAEELTRLILEGDWRSAVREIPATLQDSLTARLDRLGGVKEVAQVASVIGREFSYELLQMVLGFSDPELQAALEKLVDVELIYARGIPPEATYQFKHALIQDAAYQALLKSRRRDLHGRVARTIVEKLPSVAESQPEVIARHWTEAGEAEPATAAWKKAGEAAYSRRAFKEAAENLRRALTMLKALPESLTRDALELEVVSTLVQALQLTGGYSAPETVEVAQRARLLAEKSGNLAQLVLQLHGTWAALLVAGEYVSAAAIAAQLLELAEREGSHQSLGLSHYAQLVARFYCGDLLGVEQHFAQLSRFLQSADFRELPGAIVISIGIASATAWTMGRAEQACERIVQAIAFAEESQNPYDLAYGRYFEGALYWLLGEAPQAQAAAEKALVLSEEHGFTLVAALAQTVIGWTRARLGSVSEGVALIRRGIAGVVEAGGRVGISDLLTQLAEAQAIGGLFEDAFATLQDALQTNPQEVVFRTNILKCRGEIRLELGQAELAEVDFRDAISLAKKMDAKARELRATTALARLLARQGKQQEARARLGELYRSFNEGLDTVDLKEAKELLNQLQA